MRNEIGLNIANVNESYYSFLSLNPVYKTNYINGIALKHHKDAFSYRFAFDYLTSQYRYELKGNSNHLNVGSSKGADVRFGIEKTVFNEFIQVFFLGDLLYSLYQFKGISENSGGTFPLVDNYNYKVKAFALGISPGLGIKYRPLERFSFSLEASISIAWHKTLETQRIQKSNSISVYRQPLRLFSINYHLK